MDKPRTVVRRSKLPEVAQEFGFRRDDVTALSARTQESGALAGRRMLAWEAYQALPMPTLKDEPWRRTDIRALPSNRLKRQAADQLELDAQLRQPLAGDERAALIVARPGQPTIVEGGETLASQGVIFCDWKTALREHAAVLERYMGSVLDERAAKFSALAGALVEDGFLVYVPEGVHVEDPLHAVFWAPGNEHIFFSRLLIVVEDRASLTLVHEAASPTAGEGEAIHAGIVEIHAGQHSNLKFVELQNWGEHVWNFTHERAAVGRDAELDWIFGAVGGKFVKNFTELDLVGQGALGRMSGFYVAGKRQFFDHDTQQNHLAPNTTSDLLFKGALLDQSRSVWQGMIYVAPDAQRTDGFQANRNLILSAEARADSIPGLEILADDVRCTHGATVGQLEELPIYYLMTRGITRAEAERLVIEGFFAEVMNRIPFERVRDRLQLMMEMKLGS